ncbi:hypothetical protein Cni_G13873 [Canna indica]|uniref:Uncharacterized protein n=1 Tax=Canna indica TaxID=4628 RepID=A0AAQ3KFE1_9LILI|nr:hypothetical protein Cni_G13873 [Canna indica]
MSRRKIRPPIATDRPDLDKKPPMPKNRPLITAPLGVLLVGKSTAVEAPPTNPQEARKRSPARHLLSPQIRRSRCGEMSRSSERNAISRETSSQSGILVPNRETSSQKG